MIYRTLSDLVEETLEKLGVLPEGQTPQVEDTARVTEAVPSILDELAAREIVYISDTSNIPGPWFLPIAAICAYELVEKFGIMGPEADLLEKRAEGAIAKLKAMTRGRPTGEAQRTEYF